MRSHTEPPRHAGWLLLTCLASCTLEDGLPWGRLEPAAEIGFQVDSARRRADGSIATATGFAVTLEQASVRPESLAFTIRPPGTAEAAFDPADPPDGYSLCHNGHCHAEDGALVPYEQIALDLGGTESSAESLLLAATGEVPLRPTPEAMAFAACGADCDLEAGELVAGRVTLRDVTLRGRVVDLAPPDARRLPAEGVAFDITIPVRAELVATGNAVLNKEHAPGLRATIQLTLTERLLDDVPWQNSLDPQGLAEGSADMRRGIEESTQSTLSLHRFELTH